MFDRIRLRFRRPALFHPVNEIKGIIPHRTDRDWLTDNERIIGHLGSLTLSANQNHVFVTGSLITYGEGHNGTNWDMEAFRETLTSLGVLLSLDPREAEVMNFEFGVIVELEKPVDAYLNRIGTYPRAKRHRID